MNLPLLLLTVLLFVSDGYLRDERTFRKKRCVGVFCNQGYNPFVGSFNGFGPFGPFIFNGGLGGRTLGGDVNVNSPQNQQNCVGLQCQQNHVNGHGQSYGGQIGISGGSATQNCVGSQCQQNNAQGLTEDFNGGSAQNCFESQCQPTIQNGNAQGQGGGEHTGSGGFVTQNCVGSQCQQNNAKELGGHFSGSIAQNCVGSLCEQNNANFQELGVVQEAHVIGSSTQNCVGSQCQQNNIGNSAGGHFSSSFQNCIGSECQQNNERRKRDVRTVNDESSTISTLTVPESRATVSTTDSLLKRIRRQNQNCIGSQCQQNNFQVRGPFGGGFNGFFPFGQFQFGGAGGSRKFGSTQNCVGSRCEQSNGGFGRFGGAGATQNCVGSQCQQNNGFSFFGRRKREVRSIKEVKKNNDID